MRGLSCSSDRDVSYAYGRNRRLIYLLESFIIKKMPDLQGQPIWK